MLELTRKKGQEIRIGHDIKITVYKIKDVDGYCELGFTAPKDVVILRKEIIERDQRKKENK